MPVDLFSGEVSGQEAPGGSTEIRRQEPASAARPFVDLFSGGEPSVWRRLFSGIPATDPFTQAAITGDVARTALSALDIAAGGPLVRGLLNLAPTVPEFAGTGKEIPTATTRNLLTDIGRSTGKVGFGGFMPEAPTVEYRITPELGAKALPAAAEFALYPAVWKLAGKSVEEIYNALRPWYISERGLTPTGAAMKAYIEANRLNKIDTLAREATGGEQQAAFAAWERVTGKRHPADTRPPFAPTEPSPYVPLKGAVTQKETPQALPAAQGFELVEPAPVVRLRREPTPPYPAEGYAIGRGAEPEVITREDWRKLATGAAQPPKPAVVALWPEPAVRPAGVEVPTVSKAVPQVGAEAVTPERIEEAIPSGLPSGGVPAFIEAARTRIQETPQELFALRRQFPDATEAQLRAMAESPELKGQVARGSIAAEQLARQEARRVNAQAVTQTEAFPAETKGQADIFAQPKPAAEPEAPKRSTITLVTDQGDVVLDQEMARYAATQVVERLRGMAASLTGEKRGRILSDVQALQRFAETGARVGPRGGGGKVLNYYAPEMRDYADWLENEAAKEGVDLSTVNFLGLQSLYERIAGGRTAQEIREAIVGSARDIQNLVTPATSRGPARQTAELMRPELSKMAQSTDRAELALRKARNYFARQSNAANIDFIDKMERGQPQADASLTPVARTIRELFDRKVDEVRALGTGKLEQVIENYFPHIWKDPNRAVAVLQRWFGKRPLEGSKAFLKQRSIDYTTDGIAQGLEPVSYNPVDLTLLKIREIDKYLMAQRTLAAMREEGLTKFVKVTQRPPDGWTKIDDRIATVTYRNDRGELVLSGHYYAPEGAARIINNYLSPGLRKYAGFRSFLNLGNLFNQFQLGFSAFHLSFTSIDAAISKVALGLNQLAHGDVLKAFKSFVEAPISPATTIMKGSKLYREWFDPTQPGSDMAKMVDAVIEAGGRVRMDAFYRTHYTQAMMDAFRQFKIAGGLLKAPAALAEQFAKPIMEYIVPRQKLGVFMDLARYEMERANVSNPAEMRAVLQKVWDSVDNRMGQLVYDSVFWNKAVKDLGMASVRSLGWNLGTIREIGGAGVDAISQVGRVIKGWRPELTYRMAYTLALPIVVGLIGGTLNYLMTGEPPQELKDYYFPRTGKLDEAGRPVRISIPSYIKDIYHWSTRPGRTALNKLHPMVGTIGEMLTNEDYYSVQIRNADDPFVTQVIDSAKHLLTAAEPFSIRNLERQRELRGTTAEQVAAFFGITPAPADVSQTPAEKLAIELVRARMPSAPITKEQKAAHEARKALETGLRRKEGIEGMTTEQFASLSPLQIRTAIRRSGRTPLQNLFTSLSAFEALKVYERASGAERDQVAGMLLQKILNVLRNGSPEEKARVQERLRAIQGQGRQPAIAQPVS
jgi:hypothetical protein